MNKIDKYADNLFAVSGYQNMLVLYLGAQCQAMSLCLWQHAGHDLAYQLPCLYRLDRHGQQAGLDTRKFK